MVQSITRAFKVSRIWVYNADRRNSDATELELSEAQREIFAGWKRPHETSTEPSELLEDLLMTSADGIDLVQDITTDCSVVASLCAATARASKGHGTVSTVICCSACIINIIQILRSIVYPSQKPKAEPRVSKNGRYLFRLHFNGCFRKVTIDDRLPTSTTSRSLHVIDRKNPHLLWPALVEKAYLKVRGGYDFPGSNSGTDLWVLTGWIPEQVFLRSDETQPELLWDKIFNAHTYGDVLITLGTGKISRREEKALGLAGEHDYAVLDLKEFGLQRLLLIKNPWCDGMVWKKSVHISESEAQNETWTKELRSALPDEPSASKGTFWMSFEDVVQHFESLYLNWNPGLFRQRQDHHLSWTLPDMKNPGSFTHNPQYCIRSSQKDTVWILLSRHFQTPEQEIVKSRKTTSVGTSSALGFISLYIFSSTGGRRVYLSDEAFHRGAFVDSPQTLARLDVTPHENYTVVIAQHGLPLPKYSFTLSFFSRQSLHVETATDRLSHCTSQNGAWTCRTAGGNASASTYPLNPQYSITVPSTTSMTLILETDQEELAVHVKMVWANGERVSNVTSRDIVGGSGDYRRGCAFASLNNVAAGKYTIVCSTFEAGQTGKFTLRVGSMVPCTLRPVLSETAGRLSLQLPILAFPEGTDRMLAPIHITRLTRLRLIVRSRQNPSYTHPSTARPLLKVSLEQGQGPNKVVKQVSGNGDEGEYSDAPMGIRTSDLDVGPDIAMRGGLWLVIERLGGRGGSGSESGRVDEVEVEVLSDNHIKVDGWGMGDG